MGNEVSQVVVGGGGGKDKSKRQQKQNNHHKTNNKLMASPVVHIDIPIQPNATPPPTNTSPTNNEVIPSQDPTIDHAIKLADMDLISDIEMSIEDFATISRGGRTRAGALSIPSHEITHSPTHQPTYEPTYEPLSISQDVSEDAVGTIQVELDVADMSISSQIQHDGNSKAAFMASMHDGIITPSSPTSPSLSAESPSFQPTTPSPQRLRVDSLLKISPATSPMLPPTFTTSTPSPMKSSASSPSIIVPPLGLALKTSKSSSVLTTRGPATSTTSNTSTSHTSAASVAGAHSALPITLTRSGKLTLTRLQALALVHRGTLVLDDDDKHDKKIRARLKLNARGTMRLEEAAALNDIHTTSFNHPLQDDIPITTYKTVVPKTISSPVITSTKSPATSPPKSITWPDEISISDNTTIPSSTTTSMGMRSSTSHSTSTSTSTSTPTSTTDMSTHTSTSKSNISISPTLTATLPLTANLPPTSPSPYPAVPHSSDPSLPHPQSQYPPPLHPSLSVPSSLPTIDRRTPSPAPSSSSSHDHSDDDTDEPRSLISMNILNSTTEPYGRQTQELASAVRCDHVLMQLPGEGIRLVIKGAKPPDLTLQQATLDIVGDAFWEAVYARSSWAIKTALKLFRKKLPIKLCPNALSPDHFTAGSSSFLGIIYLYNQQLTTERITRRLIKLATQHHNPNVTLIFRYFTEQIQDEEQDGIGTAAGTGTGTGTGTGQNTATTTSHVRASSRTPGIPSPSSSFSGSFPPPLSSSSSRSISSPTGSKLDKKQLKKMEKEAKKQEEARVKAQAKAEKEAKKNMAKQMAEYEKQRINAEKAHKQMGDVLFVWKTTPAQLLESMKV